MPVNPANPAATWPSLSAAPAHTPAPADSHATSYRIYRATPNADGSLPAFTLLASVDTPTYLDTNPPQSATLYMVRAILRMETPSGTYDNPSQGILVRATAVPAGAATTPAPFKITATIANAHIQLTWPHFPRALGYRITRSAPNAPDQTLAPLLPLNTYIDILSTPGKPYTYHITPILPDAAAPTSTITVP
jgi:hypothetical protein